MLNFVNSILLLLQSCVQPPTSAANVTLPVLAAECRDAGAVISTAGPLAAERRRLLSVDLMFVRRGA